MTDTELPVQTARVQVVSSDVRKRAWQEIAQSKVVARIARWAIITEEKNMSPKTIKLIIAGVLLVHGLGHIGALMAIVVNWNERGTRTGAWLPAHSWLFPSLGPQTAKTAAIIFWVLSTVGFVAASLSFWGVLVPGEVWRQLALASSIVSILGITIFLGTWPVFNTIAALAVNLAVLATQLWLHWPPQAMFGK